MSALQSIGTTSEDRLLRVKEVIQRLGVSRATAYRLMNDGTLPVARFGAARQSSNQMLRVREHAQVRCMQKSETRPRCAAQPAE